MQSQVSLFLELPAVLLLPWWYSGNDSACLSRDARDVVWSLVWEDPGRRAWQRTPVFSPGEFDGQRSLVAIVYGVTKSQTRLSNWACTHTWESSRQDCRGASSLLALIVAEATLETVFQFGNQLSVGGRGGWVLEPAGVAMLLSWQAASWLWTPWLGLEQRLSW